MAHGKPQYSHQSLLGKSNVAEYQWKTWNSMKKEQLEIQVQCKRQVMWEQINVMVRGSVWGFSTCICQPLVHPLGVELPASHLGLIHKQ